MASIIGATVLEELVKGALGIASKYIPDAEAKANFELEIAQLQAQVQNTQVQADAAVAVEQSKVNEVEAASEDKYTSRARPTIIYVCGFGFGYQYILQPFMLFVINCMGKVLTIPTLDMTAIGTILLGLCGLRSWDKNSSK